MKKILLFSLLTLFSVKLFSDWWITRGPVTGEIYFMGPTSTSYGLYHSADFGKTAVCVDSISPILTITADKTPGVIYYTKISEALYISYNFGNQGTWQYRNSGIHYQVNSGIIEGSIYDIFVSHSIDFGNSFLPHSYNGFFGNAIDAEIDNEPGIGYVLIQKFDVYDSLFLLKSIDNFENLELQYSFCEESTFNSIRRLTRGIYPGELFFLSGFDGRLLISQDYGATWCETNKFNKTSISIDDMVGGKTEGEIYTCYQFTYLPEHRAHIYILHSTDYGITYEVFHPFSKGQEPLLTQFSAKTEENAPGTFDIKSVDSIYYVTGDMPLNVQFYNYSIGDINTYEWDFNNDGLVDSYEENPVYTYTDTGWYSVKLTTYDGFDTSSFLRDNYVYVSKITDTGSELQSNESGMSCYPNPFNDKITFSFSNKGVTDKNEVLIYDMNGKVVKKISSFKNKIVWDGTNFKGRKCEPGIYIVKSKSHINPQKIILTH